MVAPYSTANWVTPIRLTRLPLDVHLMIAEPQRYIGAFHEAGADLITFHVEAVADPRPVLQEIRQRGLAG